jgi:glycosyltransferase involved in cell wall biosynthesis
VDPVASIGAERGAVTVCLDVEAPREQLDEAVRRLLEHTPEEAAILLYGDGARVPASEPGDLTPRVRWAGPDVSAALAAAGAADVVWLRSDCLVTEGWLDGLREAAYVDSRVATAAALTTGDGPGAVHLPGGVDLDQAARLARAGSLRLRPRTGAAGDHCTYIRRSAIELVGQLPDLAGFSRACLLRGLCHVLADDVLVGSSTPQRTHAAQAPSGSAIRALAAARRSVEGLSIVIDARILGGPMNGSKRHVLELTAALARAEPHRVAAVVTPELDRETRALLDAVPGLTVATGSSAPAGRPADVVHRPFQVQSPADLRFLARLGDRMIITQQDLIGYHNPGYFPSAASWETYRALTRHAMAVADHVVFFSAHVRDEALAEGLVEAHRAAVVHIGVDHELTEPLSAPASPPPGAERIPPGAELLLCLGTDYEHKNRLFALRILHGLQQRHGWRGRLVFAGSHMRWGGSSSEEQRWLGEDPLLREAVLDVGLVSEAEKDWLLSHSRLVLYPTLSEGFGLVPFEAADHGVPCLWAGGTSLSEILPESAATIVPWDAGASADHAIRLLRDDAVREANLSSVRHAATRLRWQDTAERLIALYVAAASGPAAPAGALERSEGLMREGFSEDAVRLVGPDGALPRELERPLLALATESRLRGPVFGALRAGYELSHRLRRRRGR